MRAGRAKSVMAAACCLPAGEFSSHAPSFSLQPSQEDLAKYVQRSVLERCAGIRPVVSALGGVGTVSLTVSCRSVKCMSI